MKKDMRITYPIWQMGGIVLIMVLVLVMSLSSVFTIFEDGGFEFEFILQGGLGMIWSSTLLVLLFYSLLFAWNVDKHNKQMPMHRIKLFSWKPQEYMEDDELFQEFTKRATKKVYSYFVWAIPTLAALGIGLRVGTTGMVLGLMLLSMGQYLISYKEIRKYVGGVG